jgi:hypothetical protein
MQERTKQPKNSMVIHFPNGSDPTPTLGGHNSMNTIMTDNNDNEAISVSVTKPEHQGKGRFKTTNFLVTTKFPKAESLVRRPFEDFEWLQQRLVDERAGIIVPVLPNKKIVNDHQKIRFSEEFANERQGVLDRFLQRVVSHPELVDAPSLLPFFTANPTDWKLAKQNAKVSPSPDESSSTTPTTSTHSSSLNGDHHHHDPNSIVINATNSSPLAQKKKGVFGKWISNKKDAWALRNPRTMLEETPFEAKKFQDMQEYADHLETCVRILAQDSVELTDASRQQSEKLQTMGAAFTQLWGEHELSNTSSSTMYQTIGDCWSTICKQVLEQQYRFGRKHLETPLEELVLDVVALKVALAKRKAKVYDYTKTFQQGRTLQVQMEKLKAVDDLTAHSEKFYQLEHDIRVSDAVIGDAKHMCELISSRLERDIERFRIEWHERMRQVLEAYHKNQVQCLQAQAKQWQNALPSLATMDYSRANLPTGPKRVGAGELQVTYSTTGAKATIIPVDSDASYPEVAAAPAAAPPPVPPSASFEMLKSTSFDSVTFSDTGEGEVMGGAAPAPPGEAPPAPPTETPPAVPPPTPPTPPEEVPPTPQEDAPTTPQEEAPPTQQEEAPPTPQEDAPPTPQEDAPPTPQEEAPPTPQEDKGPVLTSV